MIIMKHIVIEGSSIARRLIPSLLPVIFLLNSIECLGQGNDSTVTGPRSGERVVLNYPDFKSVAGLKLIGDATQVVTVLRITPTPGKLWKVGGCWSEEKVTVTDGFSTTFRFQITDLSHGGGDGFAFVIQNHTAISLGAAGAAMGYNGIPNSIAVEFDTYLNPEINDPNGNHVAIQTMGRSPNTTDHVHSLAIAKNIPNLKNGLVHTVHIVQRSDTMCVDLDDIRLLCVPVRLDTLLNLDGGKAWVGFTAGSWTARENHDITSWIFRTGTPVIPKQRIASSSDVFSIVLAPGRSKIVLRGRMEIKNTGRSGSPRSHLKFKGIFGLARKSGGPFEENTIRVARGDEFFIQVSSSLFYNVVVKRESRQGVTMNFSRLMKKK